MTSPAGSATVSTVTLKHYHKNPRKISKKQFEELTGWLEEYGDLSGIVHNVRTDEIIGGNQRAEAMGFVGDKAKPVITHRYKKPTQQGTVAEGYFLYKGERFNYRQVKWSDKKAELANIIANKAGGEWDAKILLSSFKAEDLLKSGFEMKELTALGFDFKDETRDAEPRIDQAAELLKKWKVQTGDMFQIGQHRLICGDCTNLAVVEKLMGGGVARMTFTDPPWNVAIGKDSNPRHRQRDGLQNDDMTDEEYSLFVDAFISSIQTYCTGDVYCKVASEYIDIIGAIFRRKKFHWSATIIWVKDIFVLGRSKYHRRYEPMWYGWHGKSKSSFCEARNLDDVWEIDRPRVSEEHPTMMPVALPSRAIQNSSIAGDVVFEPFNGSGATLVACQNLSRRGRAIEISPAYCAVTLQRMADAFPGIEIKKVVTWDDSKVNRNAKKKA